MGKGEEDDLKKQRRRLQSIWAGMIHRCTNPKRDRYKNYGGRGIKVCEEWANNSEEFIEWSLSNGYQDGLTLDRIDVDGNYKPSNCKWSNLKEQANNKRNNVFININGDIRTVAQWSDYIGISRNIIYKWVSRYGEEYAISQILNVIENGEYTKITKKKLNCSICNVEYEGGWGGNEKHLCPNCKKAESKRRSREWMKNNYYKRKSAK